MRLRSIITFFTILYCSNILRIINLPKELSWIILPCLLLLLIQSNKVFKFGLFNTFFIICLYVFTIPESFPDLLTTYIKITLCITAFVVSKKLVEVSRFISLATLFFLVYDIWQRLTLISFDNPITRIALGTLDWKKSDLTVFTDSNFTGICAVLLLLSFFLNHRRDRFFKIYVIITCIIIFSSASKAAWLAGLSVMILETKILNIKIIRSSLIAAITTLTIVNFNDLIDLLKMDSSGSDKLLLLKKTFQITSEQPQEFILGHGYQKGSIIYTPYDHYGHNYISLLLGVNGILNFILFHLFATLNFHFKTYLPLAILGLSYFPIHNEYVWFLLGTISITKYHKID